MLCFTKFDTADDLLSNLGARTDLVPLPLMSPALTIDSNYFSFYNYFFRLAFWFYHTQPNSVLFSVVKCHHGPIFMLFCLIVLISYIDGWSSLALLPCSTKILILKLMIVCDMTYWHFINSISWNSKLKVLWVVTIKKLALLLYRGIYIGFVGKLRFMD